MVKYLPTAKDNHFIKVEVYYNLGGYNYFTSKEEIRGYYISASPVKKSGCMESYAAFSGVKQLVKEVNRKSAKAQAEAEEKAQTMESDLVNYVCAKNGIALA